MMAKEARHVPFEEFASNLVEVFDRSIAESRSVVIEKPNGVRAVLRPLGRTAHRRLTTKSDADFEAARAAAGGWADVDVDRFLEDNAKSRSLSRPPVDL